MNVLFVTKGDEKLASTRYRVLNLIPELEKYNIKSEWVTISKMSDTNSRFINISLLFAKLLKSSYEFDVLFVQKLLFPKSVLKMFVNLYDSVVYDFDDAIYAPYPWEQGKNNEREQKLRNTLKTVSAVTTGSPILNEFASRYTSNTYCLPTSIPRDPYEKYIHKNEYSRKRQDDKTTIGWIGNPSNLRYLQKIENDLAEILDYYPNCQFMVITAGDKPVTPLIDRDDVTYQKWSLNNELKLLSEVDIGIRPLTDDEWTRAKGGFTSVIQCMALGIPVVVTPVGMLSDIVKHGQNGFHAEEASDWWRYLSELIENTELRKKVGNEAHKSVGKQQFWTKQRTEDLVDMFHRNLEPKYNDSEAQTTESRDL